MQIQRTRPETLSFAMRDSPVGLAAWLIDKRCAWSDCGGDVESVFSKDNLITNAMLYWLTDTFVSLARHYYEAKPERLAPCHDRTASGGSTYGIASVHGRCLATAAQMSGTVLQFDALKCRGAGAFRADGETRTAR
jgi:hypothetical protein